MRKRLRKKKHLGEFVEWGVPLAVRRRHDEDFDNFLEDFLTQAIEANGLAFGGSGLGDRLTGIIELGRPADPVDAHLQQVRRWLDAREDVEQYLVGQFVDLWHGPFDELDAIHERLPADD
jgi:uncharacterized protein